MDLEGLFQPLQFSGEKITRADAEFLRPALAHPPAESLGVGTSAWIRVAAFCRWNSHGLRFDVGPLRDGDVLQRLHAVHPWSGRRRTAYTLVTIPDSGAVIRWLRVPGTRGRIFPGAVSGVLKTGVANNVARCTGGISAERD